MGPKFIWVTRTAPYNMLTAHRLKGIGHKALTIPLLTIKPRPHEALSTQPDALAFTSIHAIEHHRLDRRFRDLPVFTVGERTAKLARDAGYRRVQSADGNALDLEILIKERMPKGSEIIYYSAAEPAVELALSLNERGYAARQITVYESLRSPSNTITPALAAMPWMDGVLIHSAKAGRIVAQLIADCGEQWQGTAYCISEAAADPLRHLGHGRVNVSEKPNERAMLDLLGGRGPQTSF